MSAGTLVVGASQAGLQLAVSLRQFGDQAPITLVGEELHPPYERPPLSKDFLAGATEADRLAFRTPTFYADQGINLLCGERVAEVACDGSGGVARTGSEQALPFERLALTVGASPRPLLVPGADLDGVCYLRGLDDAAALRERLTAAERVVVIGGGFIGLEAAAVARAVGKDVAVVEAADRLVARAVAPLVSEFYRQAHERRGTQVLLSAVVSSVEGRDGRVTGVRLADGRELPADLVVVGIGVAPRTELAVQLGLECDGGIVVDGSARTSAASFVAAGDCTVQPSPLTGSGRVRLESVQNATAQAQVAAATLLGRPATTIGTVPWFWSDQGDLRLQIAGLAAGYDRTVVRGEPDSEKFSVLYYQGDQLLAVDAVNTPTDYLVVRKALTQGSTLPADRAADASVPLKTLLVARPAAVDLTGGLTAG